MESLTAGFRQQFKDNVARVLQQEGSVLQKLIRNETLDHQVVFFDTIQSSEAFIRGRRAADSLDYALDNPMVYNANPTTLAHFRSPKLTRRQLTAEQVIWHTTFDSGDKLNVLLEPKSFQIKDAAWALGRIYDKQILDAFAKAVVAKGEVPNDAAINFNCSTNSIPVGCPLVVTTNVIARPDGTQAADAASTTAVKPHLGLTLAKVLKAREILRKHTYSSREKMYFVCSSKQISDLLNDAKVTSFDYNTVKALAAGEVSSFAGFTFITTELSGGVRPANMNTANAISVRDCFAFTESSIIFGKVKGAFQANIDRLPTHWDATLVKVMDSVGALRMNDKGVVLVKCAEKPDAIAHATFVVAADANGTRANAAAAYPSLTCVAASGTAAQHSVLHGFANDAGTLAYIISMSSDLGIPATA